MVIFLVFAGIVSDRMIVRNRATPAESNQQQILSDSDIRSVVSLLAGIAGTSTEHPVLIGLLLDGLGLLIRSEKWLWIRRAPGDPKRRPFESTFLHSGFSESELSDITASFVHPSSDTLDEFFRSEQIRSGRHLALRLEDYGLHEVWQSTPSGVLAAAAGTGSFIRSLSPVDETETRCVISLYRAPGCPPFTQRDLGIAQLVLSEVGWLNEPCWAENRQLDGIRTLRDNLFPLLKLLLNGSSRQEISDSLRIKVNTVNSYTKEIYRHFGVHSQPELMRLHTRAGTSLSHPTRFVQKPHFWGLSEN